MELAKAQKINLVKGTNSGIEVLRFGINWGKIKTKKLFGMISTGEESVDLDAAAFCFNKNSRSCISDCFTNLLGGKLDLGYLKHSGDDLTGDSDDDGADNETISVFVNKIPSNIDCIIFTANSFSKQTFDQIPYVGIRIYEGEVNSVQKLHAKYNIANDVTFKNKVAAIIGKMYRREDGWNFEAIGDVLNTNGISNIRSASARYIGE